MVCTSRQLQTRQVSAIDGVVMLCGVLLTTAGMTLAVHGVGSTRVTWSSALHDTRAGRWLLNSGLFLTTVGALATSFWFVPLAMGLLFVATAAPIVAHNTWIRLDRKT
jgi:hypothetical protein